MRCSHREHGIMSSLITSTPLARTRKQTKVFYDDNMDNLSPILENSIHSRRRNTLSNKALFSSNQTLKKKSFAPMVIANSDSEDEDFKKNSLSSTRKSIMKNNKDDVKSNHHTSQNQPRHTFLEELCMENKQTLKRVSRVDAILDEFVRDSLRKSHIDIKQKSDESIDAMIEQALNHPRKTLKPAQKVQKNTKIKTEVQEDDDKENFIRKIITKGHEVDLFLVKKKERISNQRELVPLQPNIMEKNINIQRKRSLAEAVSSQVLKMKKTTLIPKEPANIPRKRRSPSEEVPEQVTKKKKSTIASKEIESDIFHLDDLEWHIVNGQEGVFSSRLFSSNYIKIDPKCKFIPPINESANSSLLNDVVLIVEGNALITIDGEQSRLCPGSQIQIRSLKKYEILNTGVKKRLVFMSYKK